MKNIYPNILILFLLFSCTGKTDDKTLPQSTTPETDEGKDCQVVYHNITADELNSDGFSLYEEGEYSEAALLFKKALEMNPNHTYAGYNWACMLALKNSQGRAVDLNQMYSLLFREVARSPSRIERLKNDNDLSSIKHSRPFNYLLDNYMTVHTLYNYLSDNENLIEIDITSNFNNTEDDIIIKFTNDRNVKLIPVSRIKTLPIEANSSEMIVFEQYRTSLNNYPYMANNRKISPISTDFSDFTSSIEIVLFNNEKDVIHDSVSLYNGIDKYFQADTFVPIKDALPFGEHSFYLTYTLFYSSFMEYTMFFSIMDSRIYASNPHLTESENLSDLNFGRDYDFNALAENERNITIEQKIYNNENFEISEIPANTNDVMSLVLLAW